LGYRYCSSNDAECGAWLALSWSAERSHDVGFEELGSQTKRPKRVTAVMICDWKSALLDIQIAVEDEDRKSLADASEGYSQKCALRREC
jgi:hypothetical protein